MSKNYWLLKSEPQTFSIDDLIRSPRQSSKWDGVRNYKARNYIRDGMKVNDFCFFYHSSCKEPAIAGIVEVTKAANIDETAFDPKSDYYDPQSTPEHPRWYQVTVSFRQKFDQPITLKSLRENPKLHGMTLLKKGNRLSVMPLTRQEWQSILDMNKTSRKFNG